MPKLGNDNDYFCTTYSRCYQQLGILAALIGKFWVVSMAAEKEKFREIAWQYYSENAWDSIKAKLTNGDLVARADLSWFLKMVSISNDAQEELFGVHFAEERAMAIFFRFCAYALLLLASGLLWLEYQYYAVVAFVLLYICLRPYWSKVAARPRGWGMYVVNFGAAAVVAWLIKGIWQVQVAAFLVALVFMMPHWLFWRLSAFVKEHLFSDYVFFREVTGRPYNSAERPPVVLSHMVKGVPETVDWDSNGDPALRDYQIMSSHPVLVGRNLQYYFSLADIRLCAVMVGVVGAAVTQGIVELLQLFVVVAAVLSLVFALVAPSENFVDYCTELEKDSKPVDVMVISKWIFRNFLWTVLCFSIIGLVTQQLLPFFPSISLPDGLK